MVTPIVTAKTGVKKWSTGQGVFLPLVKGNFCNLVLQSSGQGSGLSNLIQALFGFHYCESLK